MVTIVVMVTMVWCYVDNDVFSDDNHHIITINNIIIIIIPCRNDENDDSIDYVYGGGEDVDDTLIKFVQWW